ncbi:hypothetical protein RFI_05257 [Reticulomyxa filosa]|uniref:Uncharacterized protein n=1 Tax=Reticulomyxa filosa TaxID=46433 RepID=X6P178_RETFI|nr:hypothetical protein RFI_05257 [Reticulomyxa filosa]|eukprot:ETO31863.1 hypothetical protein RFI_05257 [Reticulomyxa filosa]
MKYFSFSFFHNSTVLNYDKRNSHSFLLLLLKEICALFQMENKKSLHLPILLNTSTPFENWPKSARSTYSLSSRHDIEFLKEKPELANKSIKSFSDKPLLLIKMERLVHKELMQTVNQVDSDANINESRLDVFSQCFEIVIDSAVQKLSQVHKLETEIKTMKAQYNSKVKALQDDFQAQLNERQNLIHALESELQQNKKKYSRIDDMLTQNEITTTSLKIELDDAKRSRDLFFQQNKYYQQVAEQMIAEKDKAEKLYQNNEIEIHKLQNLYEEATQELIKLQIELENTRPQTSFTQ